MTHRPADNRLPPPPRDRSGLVAVVCIIVVSALLSLAVCART